MSFVRKKKILVLGGPADPNHPPFRVLEERIHDMAPRKAVAADNDKCLIGHGFTNLWIQVKIPDFLDGIFDFFLREVLVRGKRNDIQGILFADREIPLFVS